MNIPGFNAEGALGPTVKKYRGRRIFGSNGMAPMSPQQYDIEDIDDYDEFDEENDEEFDDEE